VDVIRAVERQSLGGGPFQIRRLHPGVKLANPHDLGFGPLGLIDHANLGAGLLVPMHEHRNDEILSYIRTGTLWHEDSYGGRLPISATELVVMNAGSGISHEESIPHGGEPVEMLQIFIRPTASDLAPRFQSHRFESANSNFAWRLIAGPEGSDAPLLVRNRVLVFDRQADCGSIELVSTPNLSSLLYVFSGVVRVGDEVLSTGDSLTVLGSEQLPDIEVIEPTALVLFQVDLEAKYTRAGSLSG
jgi:quercetin 2,3-dioxygenase